MISIFLSPKCFLHSFTSSAHCTKLTDVVGRVRHSPLLDVEDLAIVNDGDLDLEARNIAVLLLTELCVVHDLALDKVIADLGNVENDGSVLDQDTLAYLDRAGQLVVGDGDLLLVALLQVPLVVAAKQREVLASLELLLGVVDLEHARADLWPSCVHQDLDLAAKLGAQLVGLLQVR